MRLKLGRSVVAAFAAAVWLFGSSLSFVDGAQESIDLSGDSPFEITTNVTNTDGSAVVFASGEQAGGKELTIGIETGNITISGAKTGGVSGTIDVGAVDLGGVTGGAEGQFTIQLIGGTGDGFTHTFSCNATNSDETNVACIGVPRIGLGGATESSDCITFDPNGKTVNMMSSSTTNDGSESARSVVIGAGYVAGIIDDDEISVSNWAIGNFGDDCTLTSSSSSSSSSSYSSVFGAGDNKGTISSWAIGNFGDDCTLTSSSYYSSSSSYSSVFGAGDNKGTISSWAIGNFGTGCTLTSSSSSSDDCSYSSLFGAGNNYDSGTISDWAIGNFGDGCTLTSSANSQSGSYNTIFGAGQAEGGATLSNWTIGNFGNNIALSSSSAATTGSADACSSVFGAGAGDGATLSNWTVEFQGNETVSAVGYASTADDIHIGTLGGGQNSDFRFYFNDSQQNNPEVVVAGLKLANNWEVTTGETTKTAKATIRDDQGSAATGETQATYARAFAIGPNFQINIGRAREMVDSTSEGAVRPSNGTWETDASKTNGGTAAGGAGILDVLGSISKARNSADTRDSIMRIDSGWAVNCYRPVEGLSKINIINGSLNMIGNDDDGKVKFATAWGNVASNISYSQIVDDEVYNGETKKVTEIYQNNKADRAGGVELVMESKSSPETGTYEYPINGRLTLAEGQTLVFGVEMDAQDETWPVFKKTNGILKLPVQLPLGTSGSEHLVMEVGMLAIDDVNSDGPTTDVPEHTNFYVIRAPYSGAAGKTGAGVIKFSGCTVSTEPVVVPSGNIDLYKITKTGNSTIISTGSEYTNWEGLHAYWMNDETYGSGIVIGTGDVKAHIAPSNYTKEFVSEELAQSSVVAVTEVKNSIGYRLNDIKQNGNDPFITIFGQKSHQDEILGFGYDAEMYGVAFGLDFVKELTSSALVKYGAVASFSHNNMTFFGASTAHGKWSKQDMYFGGVFGAYESFNAKGLKTNLNFMAGLGYFENDMWRVDSTNAYFDAKFDSTDICITVEGVKNIFSVNGIQIGPWAEISYNRVHQQAYTESGASINAASMSKVNFDFLDTVLGVNIEKEFQHMTNAEKRVSVFARAGWNCQPVRSSSSCTAALNHAGLDPFSPVFGYSSKNSAIMVLGFRNKINVHYDVSGGLVGKISKDQHLINANISVGYTF